MHRGRISRSERKRIAVLPLSGSGRANGSGPARALTPNEGRGETTRKRAPRSPWPPPSLKALAKPSAARRCKWTSDSHEGDPGNRVAFVHFVSVARFAAPLACIFCFDGVAAKPSKDYALPVDNATLKKLYAEHIKDLESRYAAILEQEGFDAVVIHSGSLVKRTEADDQYWPLRVTPHFQHWLPLAQPDCALIIHPGNKPRLVWLQSKSFWEQPAMPEANFFLEAFTVQVVSKPSEIKALLPDVRLAFLGDAEEQAIRWDLPRGAINPHHLRGPLDRLRVLKTPYEAACLAEANRRAALGHDAVAAAFREGVHSELDLHLLYLRATAQDDPETPYKNIVAMGPHAATLHHVSYEKRADARAAESLLVDAGATYLGYCSDITRTWVKGGDAETSVFLGIVDGLEKLQQRLCAAVKVGAPYEELHEESHRQVGAVLREVGISKVSAEEAVADGITRAFYPHGLGHSLGLQCHDVGCALVKPKQQNPYLRNTSTITTGQVFTIEPGIYFIEPLLAELRASPKAASVDWARVDAVAGLGGARIEDDIVVTGGPEVIRNLTREHLPVGGGRS